MFVGILPLRVREITLRHLGKLSALYAAAMGRMVKVVGEREVARRASCAASSWRIRAALLVPAFLFAVGVRADETGAIPKEAFKGMPADVKWVFKLGAEYPGYPGPRHELRFLTLEGQSVGRLLWFRSENTIVSPGIVTNHPFRRMGVHDVLLGQMLDRSPEVDLVKAELAQTNQTLFESGGLKATPSGKFFLRRGWQGQWHGWDQNGYPRVRFSKGPAPTAEALEVNAPMELATPSSITGNANAGLAALESQPNVVPTASAPLIQPVSRMPGVWVRMPRAFRVYGGAAVGTVRSDPALQSIVIGAAADYAANSPPGQWFGENVALPVVRPFGEYVAQPTTDWLDAHLPRLPTPDQLPRPPEWWTTMFGLFPRELSPGEQTLQYEKQQQKQQQKIEEWLLRRNQM